MPPSIDQQYLLWNGLKVFSYHMVIKDIKIVLNTHTMWRLGEWHQFSYGWAFYLFSIKQKQIFCIFGKNIMKTTLWLYQLRIAHISSLVILPPPSTNSLNHYNLYGAFHYIVLYTKQNQPVETVTNMGFHTNFLF